MPKLLLVNQAMQQLTVVLLAFTGLCLGLYGLIVHDVVLDSVGALELLISYLTLKV